jgi:hypothetical protein
MSAEKHQERERKTDPCGCQFIWCRGRWWPSGLTCSTHYAEELERRNAEYEQYAYPPGPGVRL